MARQKKETTCTLFGQDGQIFVKSSFSREWVDWFKATIPAGSRSWDPDKKLWGFDPAFLDEVHAKCEETFDVTTIVEDSSQGGDSKETLYAALLEPLPDALLKRVWRFIAKEIHPDTNPGADRNLAAEVTSAWNQIKIERGL